MAAALLLLPPAFACGDSSAFTYRTGVSEVRVAFVANDEANHPIENLQPQDFAVVDNGLVIHNFRSFRRSPELKLELIVLVDTSESVVARYHQEISEVLELLSRTEWTSQERISLISFSGVLPKLVCAQDCQFHTVVDRLFTTKAAGATPLFDSLIFASDLISKPIDPGVRPVIIIFSDGEDTASIRSESEAISSALDSEAQIYAIDLHQRGSQAGGTLVLQDLAEATGGRYLLMQDGANKVLASILDDLRSAYFVTYRLAEKRVGFHTLRILPAHDLNMRFRCRRGYYYPSSANPR